MIISLRGANGAGKTTVVREILTVGKNRPIFGMLGPKQPEAHELTIPGVSGPVYVLGSYVTGQGIEGVDLIHTIASRPQEDSLLVGALNDSVEGLITKYAKKGHVLFEGAIVSHMYGSIGKLMEQWGKNSVFVFIDTPLEECLRRVEQRRKGPRDERLIRTVTEKYRYGLRIQQRVQSDGIMTACFVNSGDAAKTILRLLKSGEFN